MKKTLLALGATLLLATVSTAQSKLYVQPSVNAGIGNARLKFSNPTSSGTVTNTRNLLTYGVGLTVGYKINNFRLETGLRYDISGIRHAGLVYSLAVPEQASVDYKYHHFSIPLQAGYEIKLGKRFSITPLVGVMFSYNAGGSTRLNSIIHESNSKIPSDAFSNMYNRVSLWGTGSVQFNYKLSNKVSIFIAPTVQYMLSNFHNSPSDVVFKSTQRNYNIGLQAGVRISL